MKNIPRLNATVNINAQFTAHDWQLFSSMAGAEDAAHDLNTTLNVCVNSGMTREQVAQNMGKVMKKHAKLGALDSEPAWLLSRVLDAVFGTEE